MTSSNLDEHRPGRYDVTYQVTDSAGNTAQAHRTIHSIDRRPPSIVLLGANPQSMFEHSPYLEFGATATDNADGDLSAAIRIDVSGLDTSRPGEYSVRYDVQDSSGNVAQSVTRTVVVRKRESGGGAFGVEVLLLLLATLVGRSHRNSVSRLPRMRPD